MIKITGLALIVLCCSTAGALTASGLSKRVLIIENIIRLYRYIHDRLLYLRSDTESLIAQAASADEFSQLRFLHSCNEKMRGGAGFPESWSTAVDIHAKEYGGDIARIISPLSGVLGASDLNSQLTALNYTCSLLEARLEYARGYAAKNKKLYQQLGVLAGLGIAIFMA